jgi:hypothetical protein
MPLPRTLLRSISLTRITFNRSISTSARLAMPVQRVQVAKASEAPRAGAHKDFRFAGEGDDEVKVLLSNVGESCALS